MNEIFLIPSSSSYFHSSARVKSRFLISLYDTLPITGDWLSSRPLYQLSSNVQPELYYNLGVTLLHMNKPDKAFDFLLEVLQVHSMNPRLWLRLAECCIAVHKSVSKNKFKHCLQCNVKAIYVRSCKWRLVSHNRSP